MRVSVKSCSCESPMLTKSAPMPWHRASASCQLRDSSVKRYSLLPCTIQDGSHPTFEVCSSPSPPGSVGSCLTSLPIEADGGASTTLSSCPPSSSSSSRRLLWLLSPCPSWLRTSSSPPSSCCFVWFSPWEWRSFVDLLPSERTAVDSSWCSADFFALQPTLFFLQQYAFLSLDQPSRQFDFPASQSNLSRHGWSASSML
mmetsp:Transcript_37771/g.94777  ORF Transcript_37771/g.94777 Transcript_37771/m.94777 type:complete len:200 (+) Transcript_37771:1448-2047(+)